MTIDNIIEIIDSGQLDKLRSTIEISKYSYFTSDLLESAISNRPGASGIPGATTQYSTTKDLREYYPKQHDVHDSTKRKDKLVKDDAGEITDIVKITRLSIPEQKKIVLLASSFLGNPELDASPQGADEENMLNAIEDVFDENKLQYNFREISKTVMSEREAAELWFTEPVEKDYWNGTPLEGALFRLRMRIISPSRGDQLLPVFDSTGDMIAFGRYYETVEITDGLTTMGKKTAHFDIYTQDRFYFMTKGEGQTAWVSNTEAMPEGATAKQQAAAPKGIPNVIGKIPVIYYSQPATEWHDVQEMIDRLEKKISNHADTNDYYDSPIVFAEGDVEGFSEKGQSGKVLQGKNGAKVSYLTWDNAPQSMKMEVENLQQFIHTYTHTPNISFDNIKGIGRFSGIALKMFFMDAHLKAGDKEAVFGQGVQRRLNYIKAALVKISNKLAPALRMEICPKFNYFLPRDVDGEVNTLKTALDAGIISKQTAIKLNPLIEDYESEQALIDGEASQAQANALAIAAATPKPAPGVPPGPGEAPIVPINKTG